MFTAPILQHKIVKMQSVKVTANKHDLIQLKQTAGRLSMFAFYRL